MDKEHEMALPYIIRGKQLDSNQILTNGQKIVWRTDKSQATIELILQKIQHRIYEIAKNFNINEEVLHIYSVPLISHKKERQRHIAMQNLHACYFHLNKSIHAFYTTQEKQAKHHLKTRHSRFLTKKFILNANKKLNQTQKKHLMFCKNKPNLISKNPEINVHAHIFLCQNKDWIEEYKQSVQPVVCGRFYIRPSWHAAKTQYENLIIDPSLSFGSGHHATTAMCLTLLDTMDLQGKAMLDVGCGSGILSLAAAKLGAMVYACDTDMHACNQSIQNFATNKLTYKQIWQGSMQSIDMLAVPKLYDCICANIVSSVLLLLKKDLIMRLKQGGVLLLSGILQEHESKILDSFQTLKLVEKKQIDEWLCFKFRKR